MKTVHFALFAAFLLPPVAAFAQGTPNSANPRIQTVANVSNQPAANQPAPQVVNPGPPREYIILTGGPSLTVWEKYKTAPHDQFWGSFTRASRTRFQQLQKEIGNDPNAMYTWLVFVEGYRSRSAQDHEDLVSNLNSVRDKYHLHMVPVTNGLQVIEYLNNGQDRSRIKIADFEYYGHSNRCCFMFDYSSNIDSASKNFMHEDQLQLLHRNLFMRNAFVKSWGCHTGESMSQKWKAATGVPMIGAIGRTDYSARDEALNGIIPVLSSSDGKWVQ